MATGAVIGTKVDKTKIIFDSDAAKVSYSNLAKVHANDDR